MVDIEVTKHKRPLEWDNISDYNIEMLWCNHYMWLWCNHYRWLCCIQRWRNSQSRIRCCLLCFIKWLWISQSRIRCGDVLS